MTEMSPPTGTPSPNEAAPLLPIHVVQGPGLRSPYANQIVRVRGVVTGHSRKGYFVQSQEASVDPRTSDAIFVFSPRRKAKVGLLLELAGEVIDFAPGDNARPTTQMKAFEMRLLSDLPGPIDPVWLTSELLALTPRALAQRLNGLEGMLVGIEAGATFTAPSNPFGDYVCVPDGFPAVRTEQGGVLVDPANPERWLPGFRALHYDLAPRVNVGARLLAPVTGPLNYRAEAFQIAVGHEIEVEDAGVVHHPVSWQPRRDRTTVLTLNGFNLDAQVEDEELVLDPRRDVDDDKLYGRFEQLARAIVEQAKSPDIVALQEIQDSDGAELTDCVDATATYVQLTRDIRWLGGPDYAWADIPPESGADGGQPGGNIRNAYLYDPARVELVAGSLVRVGLEVAAFADSRKPLLARFRVRSSRAELVVANVHLASKRHQSGLFAPKDPGYDPREAVRVQQVEVVREALASARASGTSYYVTGDFNDFEFSPTLRALCADDSVNMVETLPREERYDYNHRGQLQVLMHGVVPKHLHEAGAVEYEILHGNELEGVAPGSVFDKATDHAYVIARFQL